MRAANFNDSTDQRLIHMIAMTSRHLLNLIQQQRILPSLNNYIQPVRAINNYSINMNTTQSNQSTQKNNNKAVKTFDISILQYIVCPLCKGDLVYDKANNELVSQCTDDVVVAYPIDNNIPILLIEKARRIE